MNEEITIRDYFVAHSKLTLADARSYWHAMYGNGSKQPDIRELFDVLAQMRGMEAESLMAERETKLQQR